MILTLLFLKIAFKPEILTNNVNKPTLSAFGHLKKYVDTNITNNTAGLHLLGCFDVDSSECDQKSLNLSSLGNFYDNNDFLTVPEKAVTSSNNNNGNKRKHS